MNPPLPASPSAKQEIEVLAEAVRRIEQFCHPRLVLLFGSRARGDARADSDFDLAVVVDDLPNQRRLEAALYGVIGDLRAPFDIVAMDWQHWRKWSEVPVAFEHTLAQEGKVLLHG